MAKPVVGISENKFTRGVENIFKICGAGLSPSAPNPKVELRATGHDWVSPATVIGKHPKWICVSSTPTKKPGPRPVTATTSDDITVTITFDEGLPSETLVTITCTGVDYDDP